MANDCEMNTPPLDFGTAPLAGVFDPATQTIQIRCSRGASYDVGLSDGNHFDGGTRRMRRGASNDYLEYELFQTATAPDRWGSNPGQRRSSTEADINPGVHDGSNWQGFNFRGVINPDQPTPPSGTYTDNIVVEVEI